VPGNLASLSLAALCYGQHMTSSAGGGSRPGWWRHRYLLLGLVWTCIALACTWPLAPEGPFLAAKIIYPALGLVICALALLARRFDAEEELTEEEAYESLLHQARSHATSSPDRAPGHRWSCPTCGQPVGDAALIETDGTTVCEYCAGTFCVEPERGIVGGSAALEE
jgi:hypothetical protein